MKAIIATTVLGIIMMFSGILVNNKKSIAAIAAVLFAILLGVNIWDLVNTSPTTPPDQLFFYSKMLHIDYNSLWFMTLMTGCSFLYVLLMGKEIQKVGAHVAEYFALIFFILCGLYILATYNNLLMLFLGIEILSIPQYILAGSDKRNLKSSEASLKYFLMGAFSTGILLMGIALLYGATRTFDVGQIVVELHNEALNPLALAGVLFLMIALISLKVLQVHVSTLVERDT